MVAEGIDVSPSERAGHLPCLICASRATHCAVPSVEGRIFSLSLASGATRVLLGDGGMRQMVLLDQRNSGLRALASSMRACTPKQLAALTLRVYHLVRPHTTGLPQDGADGDAPSQVLATTPESVAVLQPDLLFNITDINSADYCVRQYPLRRLVPSPPTAATLRGNAVHSVFKEMLKSGRDDRGALDGYTREALRGQITDLALRQVDAQETLGDVEPHVQALAAWHVGKRTGLWGGTTGIRAETFLLAPEVGLKGRLDVLSSTPAGDQLLELKTSEVRATLPKRDHRWQVHGYQTLLTARHPTEQPHDRLATLLYSGTPGKAEEYGIPFQQRDLQRVLELRNALALVRATRTVPEPPAPTKCARCSLRQACLRASTLLGWAPPTLEEGASEPVDPADAREFRTWYELLALEADEMVRAEQDLWRLSAEERQASGTALGGLVPQGEPRRTPTGEWEYRFACEQTSELREGDAVLLSDGDPVRGAVVSGSILAIDEHGVTVWTPERIANPRLLDAYKSDTVHDRTVRNLWRWLEVEPRLRELVRGAREPQFDADAGTLELPPTLNPEQRMAVERALAARDYLLIQGPPGTGKTSVVAEIVKQAVRRGERVLLAAFTNQAVDTMLRRLVAEGVEGIVRLGHELSVAPELRSLRLSARAASQQPDALPDPARVRAVLREAPIVATTTATWSSDQYEHAGEPLKFDLAILDEATQLTVPATLGALRFARRFVLVGDEKQLPPLVQSERAASEGLGRSLFSLLLASQWGAEASVSLRRQYRMHPAICAFPSEVFYGGALVAEGSARTALLDITVGQREQLRDILDPERPLVFVDVREGEAAAPASGGKVSTAQAKIVSRIVKALRVRGVPAERIGVIAPYRAQVAAVRNLLAADGEREVTVDTVDRFQGGEREVVLFTFGGGAGVGVHGRREDFLADPHRLNVALTRAQRKLVLVGSRDRLAASPELARLLAHCERGYEGRRCIVTATPVTGGGSRAV